MNLELNDYSGNIKLRLPKSLHAALVRQSQEEGVSLNQLCLYYLGSGVSRDNLGTDEFNHRLEIITNTCTKDEKILFQELDKLNYEVEVLKPRLLDELRNAIAENRRNFGDFIEVLRYTYPIYHGDIMGEKLPMLKVPSAKIVIKPLKDQHIDYKQVEEHAKKICEYVDVAYGDYDLYLPMEMRIPSERAYESVTIHFCCNYAELQKKVNAVKDEIAGLITDVEIVVKPCYLQQFTSVLMNEYK